MIYEVSEPIDKPFEKEGAERRNRTIKVTFYKEDGMIKEVKKFGYIDEEDFELMINQINNGEELNLDYTYIRSFSLAKVLNKHEITIKGLSAKYAFFDNNVDFSKTKIEGGKVDFSFARFGDGKVDFSKSFFGESEVAFVGAQFGEGNIFFSKTNFGDGAVDFSRTNFGKGNVYFWGSKFGEGDVDFSCTNFGEGDVNFSGTDFGKGKVDFSSSNFVKGNVKFLGTEFGEGNVYFSGTNFRDSDVDFSKTKFGECDIKFLNSKCKNLYFKEVIFRGHSDLRLAKCSKIVLTDCIIEKTLKLHNVDNNINNTSLNALNILDTKNLGQIFIDWKNDNVKKLIDNYYVGNSNIKYPYDEKAKQFVLLKENFRNIGQYDDEDNSYVEYKRCKRKDRLRKVFRKYCTKDEEIRIIKLLLGSPILLMFGILNAFDYIVLDKVGGYGTKPRNVFVTMILVILGFSLVYNVAPGLISHPTIHSTTQPDILKFDKSWDAFYHSVITFFTVGYGETLPASRTGIFLSGLESFIGVFLMSYFTVAFVRKILR